MELGALRGALDGRRPSVTVVGGVRGGGKSALVRRVIHDFPHLYHVCAPLPAPAQRAGLARQVAESYPGAPSDDAPSEGAGTNSSEADWADLFERLRAHASDADRPFVVVLDDADRLLESRARIFAPLVDALRRAVRDEVALHVVLVGSQDLVSRVDEAAGKGREAGRAAAREGDVGAPPAVTSIEVPPLRFRSAAPLLPGRRPDDRLRAYGVFGGVPGVLQHLDPDVGVGTNVRRLLLSPDGPLADAGGWWLERDLQAPARYYAILTALAPGEADWSTVHAGVPDLTRSGQVAPYLNKLIDLGIIEARRSVDAKPGGRARRYAITDPFFAFWFRFILPLRLGGFGGPAAAVAGARPRESAEGDAYARRIRPRLDAHLETIFPMICRQHMHRDALETLGAAAREGGSLWGPDYDLPVAGILANGAAYFGACDWLPGGDDRTPPLRRIQEGMRASRYGFGRERRLRLVFTGRPPSVELVRKVARDPDARLIDAEALMG